MVPWQREYLVALLSTLVLTALFYPFELTAPAERQTFRRRILNYLYLPVALAWVIALQQLLLPWHLLLLRMTRGGVLAKLIDNPDLVTKIALTLVFAFCWDVWQYWVHRAQHSWPLLWETHRFHHSETAMNTSTQARHHLLSYVVYTIAYAPMLIVFGGFAPHAVVLVLMFRVWGFVNHANVRWGFGRLTPLLAGPQWHRIHHSVEPRHLDKNFAAIFPFIDRIFGTYHRPARDEYPATGLLQA